MNDKPIKIGVIGVGHLGKHHVKHYKSLKNIKLIGLHDINTQIGKKIANKYKIKFFNSLNTLINEIDALKEELINFVKSIMGLSQPIVDGKSGRNALELALRIQDKINEDLNLWD